MTNDDEFLDDDIKLWQKIAKTLKPLSNDKKIILSQKDPTKIRVIQKNTNHSTNYSKIPIKKFDSGLKLGKEESIDKNTAAKLKSGKFPIDANLDLHGYNKDAAVATLQDFIINSYQQNFRCLLVVTGKGSRNSEGKAILRDAITEYLSEPFIRQYIIMFCYAKPQHGGQGAIYILLRRKRATY